MSYHTAPPSNPDTRPLPDGWITQYDSNYKAWFYVDTRANPPRSEWRHPIDLGISVAPQQPQYGPPSGGPPGGAQGYYGGGHSPYPQQSPYGENPSYPGQNYPQHGDQQPHGTKGPLGALAGAGVAGGLLGKLAGGGGKHGQQSHSSGGLGALSGMLGGKHGQQSHSSGGGGLGALGGLLGGKHGQQSHSSGGGGGGGGLGALGGMLGGKHSSGHGGGGLGGMLGGSHGHGGGYGGHSGGYGGYGGHGSPAPQVIYQQGHKKKSNMGRNAMLAGGAGLVGGLLVADAIDDIGDGFEQQAAYDQGFEDGGDFGGGDFDF